MTKPSRIAWSDVEPAAGEIFTVWVDQPELRWARTAWRILGDAGLTSFTNELERTEVLLRFLALGYLYHSFCQLAWSACADPELTWWAESLELSRFRVAQLAGPDLVAADESDEAALWSEALLVLVRRQLRPVLQTLCDRFGSTSLLFAALWLSRNPRTSGKLSFDHELLDEVLNTEITGEKEIAYCWLLDHS